MLISRIARSSVEASLNSTMPLISPAAARLMRPEFRRLVDFGGDDRQPAIRGGGDTGPERRPGNERHVATEDERDCLVIHERQRLDNRVTGTESICLLNPTHFGIGFRPAPGPPGIQPRRSYRRPAIRRRCRVRAQAACGPQAGAEPWAMRNACACPGRRQERW